MSKDTPAAPDYRGAAEETAQGNLEMLERQTLANRPNQFTPFGRVEWTRGADGSWQQHVNVDPKLQEALNSQMRVQTDRSNLAADMTGRMRQEFGGPMNWEEFGNFTSLNPDTSGVRKGAEEALFQSMKSRLDPMWQQRESQAITQLRNQGLRPGDEAFDTAMANLGRERNDAFTQASLSAAIKGGEEAERFNTMNTQNANLNNSVRQARVAEAMQKRGFSLNEINAIMSGQQVAMPNAPSFTQAGRVAGADFTGAAQAQRAADMDQFNADNAWWQSLLSAAGTTAMSFSDRRLKRNIRYAGSANGRKFYRWEWIWGGEGFGVIAQENLDIVVAHPSGLLMVDYGRI